MNFKLKYRGIPFTYQTSVPTEVVREVGFRGRTTLIANSKSVASPTKDVQFFGWHAAGLAVV